MEWNFTAAEEESSAAWLVEGKTGWIIIMAKKKTIKKEKGKPKDKTEIKEGKVRGDPVIECEI